MRNTNRPQTVDHVLNKFSNLQSNSSLDAAWGGFDRIYLIHYVGYEGRMDAMREELKRIGIWGRGNFCVKETVRTEQEKKIPNGGTTDSERNLALAHSEIIADAKLRNCKKILVLEDDVRFLKDVNLILHIVSNIPTDGIVNMDPLPFLNYEEIEELYSKGNDGFAKYAGKGVWGASAYVLNNDAINNLYDRMVDGECIPVADYWADETAITRYISVVNLCCQNKTKQNIGMERISNYEDNWDKPYTNIGLDFNLYNLANDNNDSNKGENSMEETTKEILPVVIIGKDRGVMTCEVIKSVRDHLKNVEIKLILSTDRSSQLSTLIIENFLKSEKIEYIYLKTQDNKFGLGAAMRNGIDEALKYSDVIMVLENDMLVRYDLDVGKYKRLLTNSEAAYIEFKPFSNVIPLDYEFEQTKYRIRGWKEDKEGSPINFGSFMIHRRLISLLPIEINGDNYACELNYIDAYKRHPMEYWRERKMLPVQDAEHCYLTLNDPNSPVIHIGYNGEHMWGACPEEYKHLQDDSQHPINHILNDINFYKKHRVLFATNGEYGPDSVFNTAIDNVSLLCGDDLYICPNNIYGRDAFYRIFDFAMQKAYNHIIYFDCDCFITNYENLRKAFEFHVKQNVCFSGVSDGGVIGHRNENPWAINPFLMFVSMDRISKFRTAEGWKFTDKNEFQHYDYLDISGATLMRSRTAYQSYRNSKKGYVVPFLDQREYLYGDNQRWTYKESEKEYEPYYDIFLGLNNETNAINYLIGRDYPCEEDPSGTTSALYWFDSNERVDLDDDSRIICLHTWYARTAHWNKQNNERIKRIANKSRELCTNTIFITQLSPRSRNAILKNPVQNRDVLPIVIVGRDRGLTTCAVVQGLLNHIKGMPIKLILSFDRSNEVSKFIIREYIKRQNIDAQFCNTTPEIQGVGGAMKIGIETAMRYGDVAILLENDFILQKDLDVEKYMRLLENSDVGYMTFKSSGYVDLEDYEFEDHKYQIRKQRLNTRLSDPISLGAFMAHRRFFDLAPIRVNCSPFECEDTFCNWYKSLSEADRKSKRIITVIDSEHYHFDFDDTNCVFVHAGYNGYNVNKEPPQELKALVECLQDDNKCVDNMIADINKEITNLIL